MTEENKEVVEETTEQPIEEVVENKTDQPRDDQGRFKSKFESAGDDSVIKVDLSKPPTVEDSTPTEQVEEPKEEVKEEVVEEVIEEVPVIEQVSVEDLKEDVTEESVEKAVEEAAATGTPLPENIQKLVDFMDETGGD